MQITYISGIKSVIMEGARIFEMETSDAPLSAKVILISKPLTVEIKRTLKTISRLIFFFSEKIVYTLIIH